VDDRATNREYMVALLGYMGHRLLEATDGEVALTLARAERPDLIIADIVMPVMDGYELARQVRADPVLARTQIVFFTSSYIVAETKRLARACGVEYIIAKPAEPQVVLDTVNAALQATQAPLAPPVPEEFHREHMRLLTDTLANKVEELEAEIAERKQAEEALRALFAAMTDIVLVLDRDGRYLQIAPTNPLRLVRPPAELLGRTVDEITPAEAPGVKANIRRALDERQPIQFEYSLPIGGVQVWFDATISPMGSDRVIWIARDITQRIQREREIEAIAAVSIALRTANTQAQMLPIALGQVMALLDAGGAALAMRDPDTEDLVIALGQGEMAAQAGLRLPAGAGIGGQAVATGQPYITDDLTSDPHWYAVAWDSQARAAVCVPLITSSHILGVLWAVRTTPFSAVEVRVLSAIAGIAASAIQRAGLHDQTEQRLQRLAALREIDNAIMQSLDLHTTLMLLLGHVTAQLGVDAADILLLSRGMNDLEYAAGRGFRSKAVEQVRLRLGEGHAGKAALERRLVAVPDIRSNPTPFGRRALLAAESFIAMFCVPLLAKGQVVGVLEVFHREPLNPDAEWLSFLETLAGQAAIAVADALLFTDLQRSNTDMLVAYDTTLEGWSAALDLRDKETEGHSQRVTDMALQLARALGVSDGELEHVRRGALLHDIGKMGIPDSILLKPDMLTDDEWVIMRQHPRHAYELLAPIAFLRQALDIPYCHHEKWDGTGYPRKLKGDVIPLSARIFAVVDVWDALRSDRPYRPGWPEAQVLDYIRDQAGKHFEPRVVEAFLSLKLYSPVSVELA
jgi:putative nucleotidyltransferase with HDIG domain/PAS domain S-box-containing protein